MAKSSGGLRSSNSERARVGALSGLASVQVGSQGLVGVTPRQVRQASAQARARLQTITGNSATAQTARASLRSFIRSNNTALRTQNTLDRANPFSAVNNRR